MNINIHYIDAFTDTLFKGNSAAVVITDNWLTDVLMQKIATENNLSETAFMVKSADGRYGIRWFSPLTEIDFCGHATLASAFVLFSQLPNSKQLVFIADAVGELTITKKSANEIEMVFPNQKPENLTTIPDELLKGLSITPVKVLRNRQAYFVIYANEQDVIDVIQDNERLTKLAPYDVVVTAPAINEDYDFVSRYFWPANGGNEDPVTGSIHTGLAPYWAEELKKKSLHAYQASKRGGHLYCQVVEDKVIITGQAVKYMEGIITIN